MRSFTRRCIRSRVELAATYSSRSLTSARLRHENLLQYRPPILMKTTSALGGWQRSVSSQASPDPFGRLDVLSSAPAPTTSVDMCLDDGFKLSGGITLSGGNGVLIVDGEVFAWRPWQVNEAGDVKLVNQDGQVEVPEEALGLLDLLWPRPDLLLIGVGRRSLPLSMHSRRQMAKLGIRVEVMDTRNAAAQFNLLATERGLSEVAAALLPIGWQDGGARDSEKASGVMAWNSLRLLLVPLDSHF